jgi:hypothetical protein
VVILAAAQIVVVNCVAAVIMQIHWIWGPSGCGKPFKLIQQWPKAHYHSVALQRRQHSFHAYDGESVLIIDEVASSYELPLGMFIQMATKPLGWTLPVLCGFEEKPPAYTTLVISSTHHPSAMYGGASALAGMPIIYHHLPDRAAELVIE